MLIFTQVLCNKYTRPSCVGQSEELKKKKNAIAQ